jgi:hypothetical protein
MARAWFPCEDIAVTAIWAAAGEDWPQRLAGSGLRRSAWACKERLRQLGHLKEDSEPQWPRRDRQWPRPGPYF